MGLSIDDTTKAHYSDGAITMGWDQTGHGKHKVMPGRCQEEEAQMLYACMQESRPAHYELLFTSEKKQGQEDQPERRLFQIAAAKNWG